MRNLLTDRASGRRRSGQGIVSEQLGGSLAGDSARGQGVMPMDMRVNNVALPHKRQQRGEQYDAAQALPGCGGKSSGAGARAADLTELQVGFQRTGLA